MNGQRSQRLAAIVVEHCSVQTVRNLIARLATVAPSDAGAAIARAELLEAIAIKQRRRPSAFAPKRARAILAHQAIVPSPDVRTS